MLSFRHKMVLPAKLRKGIQQYILYTHYVLCIHSIPIPSPSSPPPHPLATTSSSCTRGERGGSRNGGDGTRILSSSKDMGF
jgi:hypothetical protein